MVYSPVGRSISDSVAILGTTEPRVGVPTPARSLFHEWEATARGLGTDPMPWQSHLARIAYALGTGDQWLYAEIAGIVSRQNGKTTFVLPHIVTRLEMGRRILHAAQRLPLPRETFKQLAPIIQHRHPDARIRYAQGQESIEMANGGYYKIVAAKGSSPRGIAAIDDLIIDELREINPEFVAAALPTMTVSPNPQVLYLSNAGTDDSQALNSVKMRAGIDPALAYLEWSASPEYAADEIAGWQQANPALGYALRLETLQRFYASAKASGNLAHFETEHLCRWVSTLRERLVDEHSWTNCRAETGTMRMPVVSVSMDPKGRRASVAAAWMRPDGEVALSMLYDVTGDPINTDRLGRDVKATAAKIGARQIGFDQQTDKELVKYLDIPTAKSRAINGQEFANASAQFVNILQSGRLRWDNADAVTDDLTWTSRKPEGDQGGYHAVRAQDDRPITAALSAIRAVWLASGPRPGRLRDAIR